MTLPYVDARIARIIEELSVRGLLTMVLEVSERFHVPLRELLGQGRSKAVAMARRHAYLVLRERTDLSYPEIARLLDRDHSTILYGVRLAQHERAAWGTETERL